MNSENAKHGLRSTPIERHLVNGRVVHVKRDDLYARPPAPPVAKLRGLELLAARLLGDGVSLIGCFEARVSTIGQGVAAVCSRLANMRCVVAHPSTKDATFKVSLAAAVSLGAELLPVPSNYLQICYGQAKLIIEKRGGYMIPFGFECPEAIDSVRLEAETVPKSLLTRGTLVVSCGSGVTMTGLLKGLPVLPRKIVGVSSGRSIAKIRACILRNVHRTPDELELHPATSPYFMASDTICPFPCNPFYDCKAWSHLVEHLDEYSDPVTFWNVGA